MRLALWRKAREKAQAAMAGRPSLRRLLRGRRAPARSAISICARWASAIKRNRRWIIVPTVLALVLSRRRRQSDHAALQVRSAHPDRRPRERFPAAERRAQRGAHRARRRSRDQPGAARAVARSRARDHQEEQACRARRNSIRCCSGMSPLKSLLALFGIGRDPFSMTPEERVLDAYYDRLTAYAVDKSRVIVVEFQSRDPELAARVANSIADGYLVLQQAARQDQAQVGEPVAVGRDRQSAQARSRRPKRASRISARSRACSSAPTTPRCPTSRWAN